LTKGFVVLIIGNSKSNHLGAQGTFKEPPGIIGMMLVGTVGGERRALQQLQSQRGGAVHRERGVTRSCVVAARGWVNESVLFLYIVELQRRSLGAVWARESAWSASPDWTVRLLLRS